MIVTNAVMIVAIAIYAKMVIVVVRIVVRSVNAMNVDVIVLVLFKRNVLIIFNVVPALLVALQGIF